MSYDFWKNSVASFLEKEKQNSEKEKEYGESLRKFEEAEAGSGHLDEEIRREIQEVRSSYQEDARLLEQERELLEQERREICSEVQNRLLALTEAESKLETAVQGRYGEAFSDALAACRRSIGNYQELLEMLRENAQLSGKDPEALRAGVQKSHGLLAEFQVQEEAVQMLVSMTGKQKAAVRYYTGTGYSLINPYLRGRSKTLDPQARQQMEELHSLLEHQRVRKPITVYRGISHDTPMVTGSARGLNRYSDEELCGKLLVDGAFVSTSLREDSAFSGTMLVLELPTGVRGAYVGDISTLKHQEREFLMDMGQAFRVTGVERKNGKRYVYAKAIRT